MKSVRSTVECRDEDELFKTLSEELPVGVCVMQDGKFCYVNSTFPIAIGYTVDELVRKGSLEIVVPEDREIVKENTMKMLKGELRSPYQFRVTCKDGGIVWVMATVKSIQYHGKRATLGNYMEITEGKQVEERIRESETRYRLLAENVADVIWTVDITCPTRLTYISPSVTRLLGYGVEESMTKEMEAVFRPASFDVAMTAFAEEMAGEQKEHSDQHRSRRLELQMRHKDGSLVDVEVNYSFIRGADGQKGGILAVARDITGRKQMQEALRDSEQRYRELADSVTDVFFAMDENLRYTYWNRGSEILTGTRAEDAIGESLSEVFPDTPGVRKAEEVYRRVLRTQRSETFVTDVDIGGSHCVFEMSAYPSRGGISVFGRDITERRQTEEALRQSEERYRTMLEEMGDGYFETDLAGNVTFANDALINLLGYSKEGIVGMNFRALRREEEATAVFKAYNRMYKTGEPLRNFFTEIICKDGRHVFAETSAFPIRNGKGEITGFRGVRHDITERKQAEDALKESDQKYRTVLEEMEEGYYEVDLRGNFTFVNAAMGRVLGYSRDELIGMNYKTYIHKENVKAVFEAYNRVYRTCEPLQWFPMVEVRKDGTHVLVEDSVLPITDDKGGVIGFRGISRDVTERTRAEEALRQSEERYRTILEEMEDSYFEVDLGGHLTFVNNSVCRDLGYSKQELIGMSYKDFTAEDDIESVFRVFNEVYRTGVPNKGFPWKVIHKDGIPGFAEASVSILRNSKGEIIGFRGVGRDITERKKAEEALNIQRAYFQQLFDTSPDAIIMMDTNDRAIQVNKGFERLFGYYDEEARGRSLIELIVPEEGAQEASKSLERILGGETIRKEAVRRRKDGSLVDVSVLAYPICSNGKLIGAYGIYTDITERRRQEQALADELTRRRILVDQSRDGIVVLNQDGKVYEANQRFAEMLGYTPEEVRELNVCDWEYLHPHERVMEMIRTVDEAGDNFETQHRRKDGSICDVEISTNAVIFAGQKLIFCVCRDVTTRKKMSEALELAAEEWRRTFDSISDAITIHDRDFKILRANKAFADLFGKSLGEIIGTHCHELHKRNEPRSGCPQQCMLTSRKPAALEFYDHHLGKYLLESTSPILNERGETVGAVCITRDITEQKRQNERLIMTDRLASVGELASGTAHELNNPLTSIIGFSQLLMEREVPDDIREGLKLINTEAQRAANVTKNLLTFARKHAPVKQLNQINSIIEDVLKLRAYEHKVNNIVVVKQLHPNLPEMMVDHFQMRQVFMNIIINAEYFMAAAHKRGTLSITTKKQNGTVRISFADDGPGIPPENLKRIFDPFFTTKETGKGTGLGLSICHGIVTEHGGQIYARSQLGKGATIFIELPINGNNRAGVAL